MERTIMQRLKTDLALIAAAVVAGVLVLGANTRLPDIVDLVAAMP